MSRSTDSWLTAAADAREAAGLRRTVRARPTSVCIDVAGNDYLGLARDARVVAAAVAAVETWGTGATGSRLVTGTLPCHVDLEGSLAHFLAAPAALVFSSGYAANLAVISALGGPGVVVISDAANHASIVDACRLARSRVVVSPHRDVAAIEQALAQRPEPRALVVVDAVFSVDGALAPLAELHDLCRSYDALLIVDEAHALGVIGDHGRGLSWEAGIASEPDVIRTVTLSKALGSQGGAVLATAPIIDHLINAARTFIFDTGLAPASVGAASASIDILASDSSLVERVRDRARELAIGLGVDVPSAAVVSVVLGDPHVAVSAAEACRVAGVLVGCFRPPSVPMGESRLRLTARADLTAAEVDQVVSTVMTAIKERQ